MDKNQNSLATKTNFYKANTLVKPIFSKLDSRDMKVVKEENRKLESILNAVDDSKIHNPNDNQTNLNRNYTNTETSNKEDKLSLLTRIARKIRYLNIEAPLPIRILTYITEGFTTGVLVPGCGGTVTPEPPDPVEEDYVKLDVPYVKQETNGCLQASVTMILQYYGLNISLNEVDNNIGQSNGYGDIGKLPDYLQTIGFEMEYKKLTIDKIEDILQENKPLLAFQHFSLTDSDFHYSVIIGFDSKKQEMIKNDPLKGKDYKESYSNFVGLNQNNSQECISFIILPK